MDLSVSIVNFNTKSLLLTCIASLRRHCAGIESEIIVVDNASTDGSADAIRNCHPEVQLIRNTENRLFAKAHNQAFNQSRGELFLILNSDVTVEDGAIPILVDFMQKHPRIGAVGCRMFFPDGRLQRNCSNDYPLRLAFLNFTFLGKCFLRQRRYISDAVFYGDWDRRSSRDVHVLPDSFLLLRKRLFPSPQLPYDPRFGLYYTENDLCRRIRQMGYRTYYLAEGRVTHIENESVRLVDVKIVARIYRRDIFMYFWKHSSKMGAVLLMVLLQLTRFLLMTLRFLGVISPKRSIVWGIP